MNTTPENRKQAFIFQHKDIDANANFLHLQLNGIPTSNHIELLNKGYNYFEKRYKNQANIDFNPSVSRLMIIKKFPLQSKDISSDSRMVLNTLLQDFKCFVDKHEYDVTFDKSAEHLISSYQGIETELQLSPAVGFCNHPTKMESELIIKDPEKYMREDHALISQYNNFYNHSDSNDNYETFIKKKHNFLVSINKSPLKVNATLNEIDNNYTLEIKGLEETDSIFLAAQLANKNIFPEINNNQETQTQTLIIPKKDVELLDLFYMASAHKMKLDIPSKSLHDKMSKLIQIQMYPVDKNLEKTVQELESKTSDPEIQKLQNNKKKNSLTL